MTFTSTKCTNSVLQPSHLKSFNCPLWTAGGSAAVISLSQAVTLCKQPVKYGKLQSHHKHLCFYRTCAFAFKNTFHFPHFAVMYFSSFSPLFIQLRHSSSNFPSTVLILCCTLYMLFPTEPLFTFSIYSK